MGGRNEEPHKAENVVKVQVKRYFVDFVTPKCVVDVLLFFERMLRRLVIAACRSGGYPKIVARFSSFSEVNLEEG